MIANQRLFDVKLVSIILGILLIIVLLTGCNLKRQGSDESASNVTENNIVQEQNSNNTVLASRPVKSDLEFAPQIAPTATAVPAEIVDQAHAAELVYINLYERISPSVINIEIVDLRSRSDAIASSGSGFVFDSTGHIITNAHVVLDAREIFVTFSDGYVASAEIVGIDDFSDLAVIKVDVDPSRLFPVTLGNSDEVVVGQSTVAIGNPFGLRSSMTTGIVSATGRTLDSNNLINPGTLDIYSNPAIIQIDAAVNPGNSGGPILNLDGEVIGIATAIRSETGTFQGIAYAVPVNTIRRVIPQLIENGRVAYPWLGITTVPSEPGLSVAALAEDWDLPVTQGVLIQDVRSNSPAAQAGLQGGTRQETIRGTNVTLGGDIIVAVDGIFVADLDQILEYLIQNTAPGDSVILTVVRGDETLDFTVILGERPLD